MTIRNLQLALAGRAMKLRFNALAPATLSVVCLLVGPVGETRAQFGPAEAVGQALENAGRNIRLGVRNAIDATQGSVVTYENPLAARVYSRLQWEKLLVGSTLELEVRGDGTAILRGQVASKEAKERAFLLARDTVGINRVIDELVVPTSDSKLVPSTDEPAATAADPSPPSVAAPPVTGPAAMIRIRPARIRRRIPAGSTTVTVQPPSVVEPPVVETPVEEKVIVQP